MATEPGNGAAAANAVSEDARKKAEEFVEAEEGATHRFKGWVGYFVTAVAVAMSLFHLYAAYDIVRAQVLRPVHVGFTLFLIFLLFPISARFRNRLQIWDVALAFISIGTIWYLIVGGEDLADRSTLPEQLDVIVGCVFIVLVLEA